MCIVDHVCVVATRLPDYRGSVGIPSGATSDACVLVCPDPVAMWFGLMHVLHAPPSRTIDVPRVVCLNFLNWE